MTVSSVPKPTCANVESRRSTSRLRDVPPIGGASPYNGELRITLRLCEITFREDLFGSKHAIEGGWKPGVNGHLHNDFHHFFACAADI